MIDTTLEYRGKGDRMMKQATGITVGMISFARSTFDTDLAETLASDLRTKLIERGFIVRGPEGFVSDLDEATRAAGELADDPPDLLLIFQATFADSTMAVAVAQMVDAPLLLWAVPEERTGGRLRLNSLCGINLAAHGLTRKGLRYDYVHAPIADVNAMERLYTLAAAGRVRRLLRRSRIGRVGEHPEGFDSCTFDREALKSRFGTDIVQIELDEVFRLVRHTSPQEIENLMKEVEGTVDGLGELDQDGVRGTLATYLVLKGMAAKQNLDGLAVRCWPQFFTELGCAACGAMSMLSDESIPCSCEADINGTITQFILQSLSGEPAFGTDLVSVDETEDIAVLWHCGLAPLSMADPAKKPRGTIHSNRQMPLLMDFSLKPGKVTLARISDDGTGYRLVVGSGEMIQAPQSFSGTSGVIRFDRPVGEILDTIMKEGLEHHLSITYGDHVEGLCALAEMLDMPVLPLS